MKGDPPAKSSPAQDIEAVAKSRLGRTLVGRFQLNHIIGLGGMATVYEATQSPLMRRVAVKVLHPSEVEAGRTDYFLREANAASNLRHPNIISVIDFGQEQDGLLFLAMEFVPGLDLGVVLTRERRLALPRLLNICEQVCLALEVAHRAGVVHCDIKPGNIMIEQMPGNPDYVKVLDFGISRVLRDDNRSDRGKREQLLGSFSFMAPEQILGRSITPQTDIYGIGTLMYVALTGTFPHTGSTDQDLLYSIVHDTPKDPRAAAPGVDFPDGLVAILRRAMAKSPADRYASAADMRRALMDLSRSLKEPEPSQHSVDGDSIEILFPEIEILDNELDDELPLVDIDDISWDVSAEVPEPAAPAPSMPPPIPAEVLASAEALESVEVLESVEAPEIEAPPPPPPVEEAPSALAPVSTQEFAEGMSVLVGRLGHAPLVGRREQLKQLWSAVEFTRFGCEVVWLSGEYGSGRSFFLKRALEVLEQRTGTLYAICAEDARERPYYALYHWTRTALLWIGNLLPADGASQPTDPDSDEEEGSPWRPILTQLGLGELERDVLDNLLSRWGAGDAKPHPYDGGPLREPETRRHLLRFAFAALLRRLSATLSANSGEAAHTPIVLAFDGWEQIDGPSHRVIRQLVKEPLPLLLILSQHGPASDPSAAAPSWCTQHITLNPLNPTELGEFIRLEGQREQVSDGFIKILHRNSQGNPLFVREVLHLLSAPPPQSETLEGHQLRPVFDLPSNFEQLFKLQFSDLTDAARLLVAICALVGPSVPTDLLRATMPDDFDVDGAIAELMGARLLDVHKTREDHLRFRLVPMRKLVLRRLHPTQIRSLHELLAHLLSTGRFTTPSEAEQLAAVHMVRSGDPLAGIDLLLDAADAAMGRWEPELGLRRFRQAQLWIDEHAESQRGSETDALLLEARSVRALIGLLQAARSLLPHSMLQTHVDLSEWRPERLLERLANLSFDLPIALRTQAALEVGRHLIAQRAPQAAATALSHALAYAAE